MKGLPGLIRFHQWKVDEQRRKVTELETLSAQLSSQLTELQAEIDREGRTAGDDLLSSAAFSGFLKGALDRRDKLRGSLADLAQEIVEARDALADAYRELKTYEIAQANRDRRDAKKRELRERLKMDEIGMGIYRRNAAG